MTDITENIYLCNRCGANWTVGEYSDDCMECGGGAMERKCPLCDGRCGSVYKRAVVDSWDSGEAHWIGGCHLPAEEKQKHREEWLLKNRSERRVRLRDLEKNEDGKKQ